MPVIAKSEAIIIRTTPQQAFNFVADPSKLRLWQPYVVEAALTSRGPAAAGATYRYVLQAMGYTVETEGIITEYQPYSLYCYQSTSGPFSIRGGFSFEQVQNFVRVTAFGEAEPGGYFAMAEAIIGLLLGRQLKITLQTLKEVLERGG
jgi:hypothetical protein